MDQHRFHLLTRALTSIPARRDVLLSLGGAGLGLAALLAPGTGEAKKKRKHKKKRPCPPCKKRKQGKCKSALPDGTPCPGGACQDGSCQTDACPGEKLCAGECIAIDQCCTRDDCPAISNFRCCNGLCTDEKLEAGRPCTAHNQCCSEYCRDSIVIGNTVDNTCDATCRGKPCMPEGGCCRGFSCVDQGSQNFRCGGCGQQADHCESDDECCFSDCTASSALPSKQCLSYPGGPCEKAIDCRSCFRFEYQDCRVQVNGNLVDICQNGVCGCPYECCGESDCPPEKTCVVDDEGLRGECKPIVVGP